MVSYCLRALIHRVSRRSTSRGSCSAHQAEFAPLEGEQEPETNTSPLGTIGYVATGTGSALLIAGAVTGALGLSLKKKVSRTCPEGRCSYSDETQLAEFENDQKRLSSYGLMTSTFLGVGGVAIVGGVSLLVFNRSSNTPERTGVRITPQISPLFAGFSARGAF